jgi:type IV secretory pathway VirJ component
MMMARRYACCSVLVVSALMACSANAADPKPPASDAHAGHTMAAMTGHDHSLPPPRDGATAATQPPLPKNAEKISHGRFDDLIVYKPQGTPKTFVLFLSGDGGWVQKVDGGVIDMAQRLVAEGAMVVGIDTPALLANFEKDDSSCVYPDGDMENLSHFIQAYYKIPTYLSPILIGYSSGATLGYATLAQAPVDTFAGLMTLGFDPALDLKKPLCPGTGVAFKPNKAKTGMVFTPSTHIGDPWIALNGGIDQSISVPVAKAFVSKVPGSQFVELHNVGHGFSEPKNWIDAFKAGYTTLAEQDKPRALPPPPASLNGLPVIEVPAAEGSPKSDIFAVLISGDGGWAGIDKDVAAALVKKGIAVVGVDSLRYFWDIRTPDGLAADVDKIVLYYLKAWSKNKVLLIGYSQGADVMPFAVSRLPDITLDQVALVALMGLSDKAAFEFHMSNWVSAVDDGLPTQPEMDKLRAKPPVLCMYGIDDDESLCPKLDPQKFKLIKLEGGHHFGGDYDQLAQLILDAVPK